MDTPMNYALVGEDGVVFNIIWLCGENRSDFPTRSAFAIVPWQSGIAMSTACSYGTARSFPSMRSNRMH